MKLKSSAVLLLEPLRPFFEAKILAVGWISGITLARLFDSWFVFHVMLFFGVLLVMTLEVVTCYGSTAPELRRKFSWETHWAGKAMILSLWVMCLVLDLIAYRVSGLNPSPNAEWIREIAGVLPFSTSSLVWFVIADGKRIVQHVKHAQGSDYIPPGPLWFFRGAKVLYKFDEIQYNGPGEKPDRRTADRLVRGKATVEELETLLAIARQQQVEETE